MADAKETAEPKEDAPAVDDDGARAAAAAVNRKRTLADWEEKKKRWLEMGVPPALPAAGSTPKK